MTTDLTQTFMRPDVRTFLDIFRTTPMAKLEALSVEQARLLMAQAREGRPAVPDDLAVVKDLEFNGPAAPIKLRLYDARADRAPGPIIVYFHGGGFALGDLDSHHELCLQIARFVDLPLLAVNYRLAPEHPWPAAPDDAEAAARWVARHGSEVLGRKVTALALAGDSAGANLAAITAKAFLHQPAAVPIIAQWLIYPTTGDNKDTPSKHAFADGLFLSKLAMDWFNTHYAAPLRNPRYDLFAFDQKGMPPTLLVTAGLDPLRDEGRAYAAALINAGVPVIFQEAIGNIHGAFSMSAVIPSSVADIKKASHAFRLLVTSNGP